MSTLRYGDSDDKVKVLLIFDASLHIQRYEDWIVFVSNMMQCLLNNYNFTPEKVDVVFFLVVCRSHEPQRNRQLLTSFSPQLIELVIKTLMFVPSTGE